jgi:hypothetical protein
MAIAIGSKDYHFAALKIEVDAKIPPVAGDQAAPSETRICGGMAPG